MEISIDIDYLKYPKTQDTFVCGRYIRQSNGPLRRHGVLNHIRYEARAPHEKPYSKRIRCI